VSHALALRHGCCYVPNALAYSRSSKTSYSGKARIWAEQSNVMERWFTKLQEPQWRDVLKSIKMAAVLPRYSLGALRLAARHDQLSPRLFGRTVFQTAWNWCRPWAPMTLRRRARQIRALWGRTYGRTTTAR
jgi:hypothetical protein